MMKRPQKQSSEIIQAINFPKKGEILEGVKVLNARAVYADDVLKYEIHLPKGTKTKLVPKILRQFFSTQVIPVSGNYVVRHHDYTVKPVQGNVCVAGEMYITQVVRMNPGLQEFDEEYSKMEMANPETYFKKHPYKGFNSPQFRAKLFSMVSYMGENYGYCDGAHIYHRRASLIMPKIKITKAVPKAKMMYHTHPKKDEPSLSSADDYLIYMDLSHAPRSIRHFYTVMEDRMDHFQIKPKANSKQNFLKLSEDKIIEEIDAKISDLEKKWDAKMPRDDATKDDNLRYCENITRDLVKWLNTKYGKYFTFKYNCYYKVKQNPPQLTADDLHLNDEFLQKAVGDTRVRTYTWPEFDTGKMPHENYAYWHQMYYTKHVKDTFMTLGVTLTGAQKRRYDQYMKKKFETSTFTNLDALNMLNLAYDIAKQDAKVRDGGGFDSRMDELCEYMGMSEEGCETLKMLETVVHQEDIFSEQAQTMCGDYYPLALLSFYSISAIHTIEQVEQKKLDPEMAKFEIYSKLKQQVGGALSSFLLAHENLFEKGFVDSYMNPPRMTLLRTDYIAKFPVEAFDLYDIAAEALQPFSKTRYDPKRPFFTAKNKFNLWVQTQGGRVGIMISQSTGTAEVVATTDNPMEDAMEAVDKVGQALYRAGLPVDPNQFGLSFDEPAVNPQRAQVITISGPSGSGKSTTIRNLLKLLPNSRTAPTVTTRALRRSDKEGEKLHVRQEEFLSMLAKGELVAAKLMKNGHYYGRKLSDFEKEGFVIIDVNPSGVNDIKKVFPNAFTVYLEPVDDPEVIRKRLLRRGDMSAKEARGRASIIKQHIADSRKMNFDMRITMKQGEFDYAAKEIMDTLPKDNPGFRQKLANVFSKTIKWDRTRRGTGLPIDGYEVVEVPVKELEVAFQQSPMYIPPGQGEKVPRIKELVEEGTPLPIPQGGFVDGVFDFTDGRHRFVYTRDYTNQKTIPIATARTNPRFKDKITKLFGKSEFEKKLAQSFKSGKSHDTRMPARADTLSYARKAEVEGSDKAMRYLSTNADLDYETGKVQVAWQDLGGGASGKYYSGHLERDRGLLGRLLRLKPIKTPISLGVSISPEAIADAARDAIEKVARDIEVTDVGEIIWDFETIIPTVADKTPEEVHLHNPSQTFRATKNALWRAVGKDATRDESGEEIGLIERDAERVQEATYLLIHQAVTDHEFAHQADFELVPGMGYASGYRDRSVEFGRETETVAQVIEGEMIYTAVVPIESSVQERQVRGKAEGKTSINGNILVIALSKGPKTMAGEVEHKGLKFGVPKLAEDYYGYEVSHAVMRTGDFADMRRKEAAIRAAVKSGQEFTKTGAFTGRIPTLVNPPKDNFDWFEEWAKLINMKNKEIDAFMKSDWFKVSGLTPGEAKEAGIRSGQNSLRAIMRMRKKLGLTGPKDYIPNGPRIIESYYEKALNNWTKDDWEWCKHQVRFNKRAGAFPYNPNAEERKGPLVKVMKTYARPSRKLLSLWVWGHDPWRWARKNGFERMSPCPNVPWIGMTEKRKWGKIEVEMSPRRKNPGHDPIEAEARRAASDPSFVHHEWYIEHHLDYVMPIAHNLLKSNDPEDRQLINDMVWMHDYPKMMSDKENFQLVEDLVSQHRSPAYTKRLMNQLHNMEEIKSKTWNGKTTTIAAVMSTADALAHYYGPFWQIYMDENTDKDLDYLKESNAAKLEKDKRKLRAGPRKDGLDGVKFQYKGRKVRVVGNDHIADLIKKKNPPSKTPEGRKIPKRYLKGLNAEEMAIAAKEIDKGYKYDIDDPKAYEYWKSDIKATARGYKTVPSKYKKKFIEMYGPLPEKGDFLTKMSKATKIKKPILQKVYDKGLAAWRGGHRPGVQQHQWAAGRVYSFVTLGNTVKKDNKRMSDYNLAIEAGLVKDNPPLFVHPDKSEKWSERYEKITNMTGQELIDLANKMAEEKGLRIEVNTVEADFSKMTAKRKDFALPPKYEKLYKEWIESKLGVNILLYRGSKIVDKLEFSVIYNKPTELLEYIENRKRWGTKRRILPHFAKVVKGRDNKPRVVISSSVFLAADQNSKRFPYAYGGAGGYEMTESQKGKGYYGIIKTMQAGLLESANLEHFGQGETPMRSDLYQSYGWLTAYSYKENAHYGSRAAEYYLHLHGTTKRPNKDADYWWVYRPVYTRKNPGASGEWRHGEFAEDDPFEEYF